MKRQSLNSIRILVAAAAGLAPLAGALADDSVMGPAPQAREASTMKPSSEQYSMRGAYVASEGLDWKFLADRPAGPQGPVREEQDPRAHSEGLDWKSVADTPAGAQGPIREVENPQEAEVRAAEEKFWNRVWPFGRKDMP